MKAYKKYFFGFWLVMSLSSASLSFAFQEETRFKKGTEEYAAGNFEQAITAWGQVLKEGKHSASLYYNLANAHYQLNDIGPSIYYYEKALLLSPNDAEIKNNLAFAKNATVDAIEPLPKTFFKRVYETIYSIATFDTWASLGVVFSMLAVLLFLIYYFINSSSKKRFFLSTSVLSFFLLCLCLAMAYSTYNNAITQQFAIVFDESIDVKKEPQMGSTTSFILHEGTKVSVIESTENWSKILISNGEEGWIPTQSIKNL